MIELTLSPAEAAAVMAQLPDAARRPESGITYVDGVLRVPAEWADAAQAADPASSSLLYAAAADRRYAVETGGCAWGELTVQTDRDSQAKLVAEFVAIGAGLRADPSPWKFAEGFYALSNAEMTSVITTARAHVAEAFATEAAVRAAIADGTITTASDVDAAF